MYTVEWTSAGVLQSVDFDSFRRANEEKQRLVSLGYVAHILYNGLYIDL